MIIIIKNPIWGKIFSYNYRTLKIKDENNVKTVEDLRDVILQLKTKVVKKKKKI